MIDRFGRTINYLRISVTDRCNLRCRYCRPARGGASLRSEEMLSREEIVEVAEVAASMGVNKIRLTGGEPLMRPDIASIVKSLASIAGVEDLAMSTNGALLADRAEPLAAAGLRRVNVSIDAMRPDHYAEVTRGGDVRLVLAGIDAARAADLAPIKLNCVVGESSDEPDAQDVAAFARENGFEVRFIHNMDLEKGEFSIVEGGSGGDCPRCNRLRLSSDGFIRPCLFSDLAFSVRELGPAGALSKAVRRKPRAGGPCTHNWMYGIGG